MNPTILLLFLSALVVAYVECQQTEGEECPGIFRRRCRTNEYCLRSELPFMSRCVAYRGRGMPCDRINRCKPGLECTQYRDSFFRVGRCQDPSTTSTTTVFTTPATTSMPDSTTTVSTDVTDSSTQ
ncbi:uncharacterized protein LOC129972883 [Argiope bruennichi]|uniref:uncharacterized protein LOC129972883 n=1 Tax=Argiope bruennichi TaxID=94029 RepID=UPI0024958C46|nr:uncharacterized protein LOC129972883 [Argiope bruennichi]